MVWFKQVAVHPEKYCSDNMPLMLRYLVQAVLSAPQSSDGMNFVDFITCLDKLKAQAGAEKDQVEGISSFGKFLWMVRKYFPEKVRNSVEAKLLGSVRAPLSNLVSVDKKYANFYTYLVTHFNPDLDSLVSEVVMGYMLMQVPALRNSKIIPVFRGEIRADYEALIDGMTRPGFTRAMVKQKNSFQPVVKEKMIPREESLRFTISENFMEVLGRVKKNHDIYMPIVADDNTHLGFIRSGELLQFLHHLIDENRFSTEYIRALSLADVLSWKEAEKEHESRKTVTLDMRAPLDEEALAAIDKYGIVPVVMEDISDHGRQVNVGSITMESLNWQNIFLFLLDTQELPDDIDPGTPYASIDHRRQSGQSGGAVYQHLEKVGATATKVAELYLNNKDRINMPRSFLRLLMLAIYDDTGFMEKATDTDYAVFDKLISEYYGETLGGDDVCEYREYIFQELEDKIVTQEQSYLRSVINDGAFSRLFFADFKPFSKIDMHVAQLKATDMTYKMLMDNESSVVDAMKNINMGQKDRAMLMVSARDKVDPAEPSCPQQKDLLYIKATSEKDIKKLLKVSREKIRKMNKTGFADSDMNITVLRQSDSDGYGVIKIEFPRGTVFSRKDQIQPILDALN